MSSFAVLLKNDIRLYVRDWKACILLLAAPVLFIYFFTSVLSPYINESSFIEPFPIAVVDMEDTTQTRMLIRQIEEIGIFSEIVRLKETDAIEELSDEHIGGIIIIPQNFTESIAAGENKPVTVIGSSSMPLKAYVVKNVVQSAANLVSAAQSAIIAIYHYDKAAGLSGKELDTRFNNAVADFFLASLARNEVFADSEEAPQYSLTPVEYFTAALIVIFMMFAGMPAMKLLVTEKSEGVTERLYAAPVSMLSVVLSKLLVSALLLLIQFGMIIIFTSTVFNNYWGAPIKNVIMLFTGLIFAVSAWSIFVASISTTPASADIIGNLGILLMAIVGGNIYPLSSMPLAVRNISRFTISRWAMDGFMVLFSGNDAASTFVYTLALTLIGLVLFIVSAGIMKFSKRG